MRYKVTCLSPTLVGDGQRLAPVDYMVWKDHVNVLDQRRIFKLLAKGPRLDGYLMQLKKSDKLDFASWGGFAQNFAGRRIPFEHSSAAQYWEKTRPENLFIPTFASGVSGPFLPGSAVKGVLRTGAVHGNWSARALPDLAAKLKSGDLRALRRAAGPAEDAALGAAGANAMRFLAASDSAAVSTSSFRVYLLRVATLESRDAGKYELAWKQTPRGSVRKPEDATPLFAEMADPGTEFEGDWKESDFLRSPEVLHALRRGQPPSRRKLFEAANAFAADLLAAQSLYALRTGLARLAEHVAALERRLGEIRESGNACLACIGWGGGLLSKSSFLDTEDEGYRQVLRQVSLYSRAIQSGLPFPKTRKIVFEQNQPASLPGWVQLEAGGSAA